MLYGAMADGSFGGDFWYSTMSRHRLPLDWCLGLRVSKLQVSWKQVSMIPSYHVANLIMKDSFNSKFKQFKYV
jgi:hypothetical protein